jgi:hypothetical protein
MRCRRRSSFRKTATRGPDTVLTTYLSKACGNRLLVSPRMPNGCSEESDNCVPDDYIAAVEQWTTEGAKRP